MDPEHAEDLAMDAVVGIGHVAHVVKYGAAPLDAFVLTKLEQNKLTPALPAGRLALLRRAHFDLTGLPPTPEEIEEFAKDKRPEAYAELVDRLLTSSQYGERWGRHWLDVVRYADTGGFEADHV